ncbi:MAG: sulfotransferase [Proteobacteria bacterium]|nr:sulfotransferase [Pseudomonadota bacterium]
MEIMRNLTQRVKARLHLIYQRISYLLYPQYWSIHRKYRRVFGIPQVVYIVGMPRTGSTLAKRFLGDHKDIYIAPFGDFSSAYDLSMELLDSKVVLAKRTAFMRRCEFIYRTYGNQVAFLGIVRDPRDELVSLLEFKRHPEIPRDETFWSFWEYRYSLFLKFAKRYTAWGAKIALVRYEDLVIDPIGVKKQFLEWLGLNASIVVDTYNTTLSEMASGAQPLEDEKAHQTNRVHSNSVGRWREVRFSWISLVMAYKKFHHVEHLMKTLGYNESIENPTISADRLRMFGTDTFTERTDVF